MSLIYKRNGENGEIRMGYYPNRNEYVVYVGMRLYAVTDNIGDAYRIYNRVK